MSVMDEKEEARKRTIDETLYNLALDNSSNY
jgi:hypothetical protein